MWRCYATVASSPRDQRTCCTTRTPSASASGERSAPSPSTAAGTPPPHVDPHVDCDVLGGITTSSRRFRRSQRGLGSLDGEGEYPYAVMPSSRPGIRARHHRSAVEAGGR